MKYEILSFLNAVFKNNGRNILHISYFINHTSYFLTPQAVGRALTLTHRQSFYLDCLRGRIRSYLI